MSYIRVYYYYYTHISRHGRKADIVPASSHLDRPELEWLAACLATAVNDEYCRGDQQYSHSDTDGHNNGDFMGSGDWVDEWRVNRGRV